MGKFGYFCNSRSLRWKIIISSIALILWILVFIPTVSSVDSEYKFPVSIKINELCLDDIEIIPIEASDHIEYGQKVVEKTPIIFGILKVLSKDYMDYYEELNNSIYAWEHDENENF